MSSFRVSLCRFYTVSDQNSGSFPADLGSLAVPVLVLYADLLWISDLLLGLQNVCPPG
jgi:hypothetical protein